MLVSKLKIGGNEAEAAKSTLKMNYLWPKCISIGEK